jgi:hypothetical protein
VNVRRSSNTGIDRIALDDGWEGGTVPSVPTTPRLSRHASVRTMGRSQARTTATAPTSSGARVAVKMSLGRSRGADGDEDRLLHPQDSGLQRRDVLKDFGVAGKDSLILGIREIALCRGVFERQTVPLRGSVPRQQDEGRGVRRLGAKRQVQEDEREGVKRAAQENQIGTKPECNEYGLKHQEGPAAHELSHSVSDLSPEWSRFV